MPRRETRRSFRSERRRRLASILLAAALAVAAPFWESPSVRAQGLPVPAAKLADACQRALLKAAAAFAAKQAKLLGACTARIATCLETKPDGVKRDACVTKAGAKCGAALDKIAAAEAKLEAAIGKKCGALGALALLDPDGLGYGALAGECAALLGAAPATVAGVADCVAAATRCQVDALVELREPRARELLRHAGVFATRPDPLSCLPDHGGNGAAVAARATEGKALDACGKAIKKAAGSFVAKTQKLLASCVAGLFTCRQKKPTDATCIPKAVAKCGKSFAKIADAEAKLPVDLTKKCTAARVAYATLLAPAGLRLEALADACAEVGIGSVATLELYAQCLVRQHECRVEELLRLAAPRAEELLALAGRPLRSAFCPGAEPVATPTSGPPIPTPSATRTPTPAPTLGAGVCGNGVIDGAREVCDGGALAGESCTTLGFTGGTLSCAASCRGFDSTACELPAAPPPDPGAVAPAPDLTTATGFGATVEFLFAGDPPIQYGVGPGTIDPVAAAVIRGTVLDMDGVALPGVEIRILDRPEFGATQSRADGGFDLVVNGGGPLTVQYAKAGFLPAQRQVQVPWQQFTVVDDVRLCPLDPVATIIDLAAGTDITVARGSEKTDADGTRQATLLIEPGTAAEMLMPDGSTQPLTQITVRATEFTVGAAGPQMMPAVLPPTSGYTYAVEFSLDEAIAAGAPMVQFDRPIATYVENFPGFPAGTPVPAGFYDYLRGAWVAAPNGRVIDVVGITDGLADLDVTGDGAADTGSALTDLGIDDAERAKLATLYAPGTSLWRVPVDHFSTWDYNWPFGPPGDAISPDESGASAQSDDEPIDGTCEAEGSVIECENQVLGEDVLLAGTPYTLHYRSDRVPGRLDSLDVRLSGASLPASLQSIRLRATVAGQTTEQSFAPSPNQSVILTWNGTDPYGRPVQGGQRVTGAIEYVYPAVFRSPAELQQAFAQFGGNTLQANRSTSTVSTVMPFEAILREGITDARGLGLGGWTLGVQHFYDPTAKVLHLGHGARRRADSVGRIIDTVLESTGPLGGSGSLSSFTFAPDGSILFARFDRRIRRLAPDGTETIVAGTGQPIQLSDDPFGDGGPATQAKLITSPAKLLLGADGSLHFVDNHVLRRVRPDGIIERLAGIYTFDGLQCSGGNTTPDGAVALTSRLCIDDFVVTADGTLILGEFLNGIDDYRIRRIGSDGTLVTIVGGGGDCPFAGGACGDGGPAVSAQLQPTNHRIALAPDGTLYLSEANRVRKVTPDGIITAVAGANQNGLAGDGLPAGPDTRFFGPQSFAFPPDGAILIGDVNNHRIRRIAAEGLVSTIAGSGPSNTTNNIGQSGDTGPALQALMALPRQIALAPNGDLFVLAGIPSRIRRIGPPLRGFTAADILIASEDGRLLYAFDPNGKHLATFDALTGALRRLFVYDDAGRLEQIVEKTGGTDNVTTIERDLAGHPTAIVGPFGKTTTLTVDGDGFLASITNPAGETRTLVSTATGLLTSYTLPGNRTSTFTYDASGRLLKDEDPGPGSQTLARSGPPDAFTVTRTTALGRATSYQVERLPGGVEQRTIVAPDGTAAVVTDQQDAATRESTAASGSVLTQVAGPDPRFGMEAPVATSVSLELPSALTATATNTRSATVSDPFDPLSLVTLAETSTLAANTFTTAYTAATRTFLTTTPLGRTRTLILDALGRPVSMQASGGVTTTAAYDARGRLAQITTGSDPATRVVTFTYDAQGLPATVTDPVGRTVTMERDAVGRLTRKILPDGDAIELAYDAAGDLVALTPPGRPAHTLAYDTRRALTALTPPVVPGTGSTTYAYDDDGALSAVTRPDESVTFTYDGAGRLATIDVEVLGGPQGTYALDYDATTGQVTEVTGPEGAATAYTYDGGLVTSVTWAGPVTGTLAVQHDARLAVATETVNGTSAVSFSHDADDHLVAAGDLAITRDPATGLPATTTLGVVNDAWSYDGFGDLIDYEASANGTALYAESYEYDKVGRIVRKVETIGGETDILDYTYDAKGQLIEVRRDDVLVEQYDYDPNGNRTAATVGGSSVTATYDDQDRLLTYGAASFTYSPSGRLATRTAPSGTTTYTYDAAGNLLAVGLPAGTDVAYTLDPGMRRVARDVDGLPAGRFLWSGNRPIAELDETGALVSRFVYAGGPAPAYLVRGGVAHRLIVDHVGSVRLVVDATTGAVVQRLDYDSFGRVTQDTNPGFQPFGFAGGLYDPVTGLVRFDARDYDAVTGRFTAKDPIGFAGLDTNLYRYAGNDPVNLIDPSGLTAAEIVTGILSGLVDVAMLPVTLSRDLAVLNALATEAVTGIPQPVPPDPNPIVGIMEGVNAIADFFFDAEPVVEMDSTAFRVSRICTSVLAELGLGGAAGLARGGAEAAARGGIRPAMQAVGKNAKNVGRTADEAYRPLVSAEAAKAERLAAEGTRRAAEREARQVGQQAGESRRLELVRPEGGGAGTRGAGKPAGGFGIGR